MEIRDLLKKAFKAGQDYGSNRTDKNFNDFLDKHSKQLRIADVSVSLPIKDEVVSEGYRIAKDVGYNYRRVLKDLDHDIYYSGWMDCYDWISKGK